MIDNNHSFPSSTPRNFMPNEWQAWYRRLCPLLDISAELPLESQSLPRPWFLIPKLNELSGEDASDLLEIIERFLLGGKSTSLGRVRSRLLSLRHEATLPFLYAMRYVAFREAERRYYWPAFTKLILNDRFPSNMVAISLASSTSTLWLRLYEATKGALYYPREGLRHIKWPIAHAGLLPDDKELLRDFGLTLMRMSPDLYDEVCVSEIDEFILNLGDWIDNNREHTYSRLGQLINGVRTEREVIAELGQQWLAFHRQELEEQNQTYTTSWESVPSTRRRLTYDMPKNRLLLSFSLGRIHSAQTARLQWDDREISFQSQYDPVTDETVFLDAFMQLENPKWPDRAVLHIGSKSYEVNVPVLEPNRSIVFDPSSGNQTKRWEFGQEYFVLMPGKLLKSATVSHIFAAWSEVGTPQGQWQDYSIFWVRNRDPFAQGMPHGEGEIVDLLESLEQAVDEMKLPSFGHQYRVRMSLVGGEQIDTSSDGVAVFSTGRPPYLEIRGIWNENIRIALLRQEKTTGVYERISTLTVDQEWAMGSCIVELWENYAQEDRYRVVLSQHQVEFIIASKAEDESQQSVPRVRIEAHLEDAYGNQVLNPSRYNLENLKLCVTAWPQADLIFEISGGETARYHPIQTDDNGLWEELIENIPFELSSLPNGPIHFRISWRGIFSQHLLLSDQEQLRVDSLKTVTTQNIPGGRFEIHYQGTLRSKEAIQNLRGILLADPPWHTLPCEFNIYVSEDNTFSGEIILDWCPSWMIIDSEKTGSLSNNSLIAVDKTDKPTRYPSSTYSMRAWEQFFEFARTAKKITEIPHPPELDPYIAVVPAIEYLYEAHETLATGPQWQFISEWDDLRLLEEHLVFENVVSLFGGKPDDGYPREGIVDHVKFDFSKSSANRFLYFRYKSQNTLSGRLRKSPLPHDKRIILESFDTLWRCPHCKMVLPIRFQNDHLISHEVYRDVRASENEVTVLDTGTKVPGVLIGIGKSQINHFRMIGDQLKRVLKREKGFEPEFIEWLKYLSHFVPPETDREIWLQGIVEALDHTWNLFQRRNLRHQDLELISRFLIDYQGGLTEVLRRVRGNQE